MLQNVAEQVKLAHVLVVISLVSSRLDFPKAEERSGKTREVLAVISLNISLLCRLTWCLIRQAQL